ncbi:MAG: cytochrome c [Chitinophagaceae bacterium]|nr:cytochrome c [Rubrivivax sp.]
MKSSRRRLRCAALVCASWACVTAALAADAPDPVALGRQLFTKGATPSCAVCHTLKDASAAGAVGPVLDELKPDARRVAAALRNGIGQMPSYKALLSEAQIQALAEYVAGATAGSR